MKSIFFQLMVFLFLPMLLAGQWSTDPAVNNPINIMSGEQAIPKIATCPNGDSYIAFFCNESGNYNVRMQRLDPQGNELWETDGILISDHTQMSWLTDWDVTADNSNHAILTFQDIRNEGNNNVVAYRIAPDGSFVWGDDGIALSNSTAFDASPKVTATAAGNAVFAWQADDIIILQKVSPAGSLQWGEEGIILSCSDTYSWPQLLPVGNDDVILKYFHDTPPTWAPTRHVYAQRFDADGDEVWTSPVAISTAGGISAWTQIFPFINDGSDGFYIAWHDDRDNNMLASTFVQHISSTGTVIFSANGVEASTMGGRNHFYPQLALPPESSDVFVYWNEMDGDQNQRGIYGQKISSDGTRLWTNNGKSFIELSSTNVYPVAARHSPTDMILIYEEYINALDGYINAMRIDTDGDFVWTPDIAMICSVNSEKVHTVVNHFNNNQWIVSWEDDRNGNRDIYAQNIQLNGELGPWVDPNGTIQGTVDLSGGNGSLVQVGVTAGDVTVYPDFLGNYTMVIENGTWDILASLPGYHNDTVYDVIVIAGEITPDVDFTLDPITGFIDGSVTLFNGTADITEVTVNAGTQAVHPDPDGNYILELPPGTYTVYASHPYTLTDSVTGIQVEDEMTITDVNFNLEVVYADLICKAFDQYFDILNFVDVEVTGPDSTFSGFIENDSIVFHRLHYGTYNGEAWSSYWGGPVYAEIVLGEDNHYMEFVFVIGGLADGADQQEFGLKAVPNPFMDHTKICFNLEEKNKVTIRLFDLQGNLIGTLHDGELIAGEHQIELSAFQSSTPLKPGMYYIVLESMGKTGFVKIIKR